MAVVPPAPSCHLGVAEATSLYGGEECWVKWGGRERFEFRAYPSSDPVLMAYNYTAIIVFFQLQQLLTDLPHDMLEDSGDHLSNFSDCDTLEDHEQ